MKKYGFLIFFLGLLVVGGAFTVIGNAGGVDQFLPFLRQTADTAASTDYAEPWQAEQLFLLIAFVMLNIVGIGVTLAGLLWFLNRGVKMSKAEAALAEQGNQTK